MKSIGKMLLSKIITDNLIMEFGKLKPEWFYQDEVKAFSKMQGYVLKYGQLPELSYIEGEVSKKPYDFIKDEVINRHLTNRFTETLSPRINQLLSNGQAVTALNELQKFVMEHELDTVKDLYSLKDLGEMAITYVEEAKTKSGITGIPTGWATLDRITAGWQRGDVNLLLARPKSGKGLLPTEPVLTPKGWKAIGDLKEGEYVFTQDGTPTKVTGVYPQELKPIYQVTMTDGGSLIVDNEHLWLVKHRSADKFDKVKTTQQLIDHLEQYPIHGRVYLPLNDAIVFRSKPVLIEPYLLGLLLGDGSMCNGSISLCKVHSEDRTEILNYIETIPHDTTPTRVNFLNIKKQILKYGLDIIGYEKFIPECYKINSYEIRLELLKGLMDTDGYISKDGGTMEYNTSSSVLATDIAFLVGSLGGLVRKIREKIPTYTYKGKRLEGRRHYTVCFQLPVVPFKLGRKANKFRVTKIKKGSRAIKSITPMGKAKTVCIKVEHESGLFIAKDFIVTHNTQLLFWSALYAKAQGYNPLIISMEMKALQSARRIFATTARLPMQWMKTGSLSHWGEQKLREAVAAACTRPFFIEGQFKKSIQEIAGLIYSMELDIVYIDGGYLIKILQNGRQESKWERMSEIIETLKTIAIKANIPVVVTFQFNRQVKRTDAHKAGLEHVQLADAIGQIASVALGIFDDENLMTRKRIEIIDDRESEGGGFTINWDWSSMDFSEVPFDLPTSEEEC